MAKRKTTAPTRSGKEAPGVSLISISGSAEALRSLINLAGLSITEHSARPEGHDAWSISAYATADAIAEARARGGTVSTIMSEQQLLDHQRKVFAQVEHSKPRTRRKRGV